MIWVIAAIPAIAFLSWQIVGRMSERRRRRKLIQGRERVPLTDIIESLAGQKGKECEMIADVWLRIASILHLEPGQLRIDDTVQSLSSSTFLIFDDVSALEDFVLDQGVPRERLGSLRTIGDIVNTIVVSREVK